MEESLDKAKGWVKSLWTTRTPGRDAVHSGANLVTVDQLPLYGKEEKITAYRFVEDKPLPTQQYMSEIRQSTQHGYEAFMVRFGSVQRAVNSATNCYIQVRDYVKREGTVLPKAMAITLGGMAGFLLGMRRGAFKRVTYSAVGMGSMAAFCYPHETVDLLRSSSAYAAKQWSDFQHPPLPLKVEEKKIDLSPPPNINPNENIDMYSTRSTTIS
uniref:MICOS complex subunit n=1 Tax=Plectus sambesii TaxID=2011161 RepID=A0A914W821_9BILA